MKLPTQIKGWLKIESSSEELLLLYHRNGDKAALSQLVERFHHDIFHYLLSLSNRELAEDIVQTLWLKMLYKPSKLEEYKHVKSWLFSVARNALFDELRKQNKYLQVVVEETHLVSEPLDAKFEQADKLAVFNWALEQIPFYQREAIIFQQEGLTLADIALITDESIETVKSRLRYGKRQLKVLLETYDAR